MCQYIENLHAHRRIHTPTHASIVCYDARDILHHFSIYKTTCDCLLESIWPTTSSAGACECKCDRKREYANIEMCAGVAKPLQLNFQCNLPRPIEPFFHCFTLDISDLVFPHVDRLMHELLSLARTLHFAWIQNTNPLVTNSVWLFVKFWSTHNLSAEMLGNVCNL